MLEFMKQNIASIIVLAIIVFAVVLAICKIYKNKKQGKSACGCDCGSCMYSGKCHKENKK